MTCTGNIQVWILLMWIRGRYFLVNTLGNFFVPKIANNDNLLLWLVLIGKYMLATGWENTDENCCGAAFENEDVNDIHSCSYQTHLQRNSLLLLLLKKFYHPFQIFSKGSKFQTRLIGTVSTVVFLLIVVAVVVLLPFDEFYLLSKKHCQSSPFTSTIGQNGLNWQCCLAGSSKTAPRILIFSIAMGAKPSF